MATNAGRPLFSQCYPILPSAPRVGVSALESPKISYASTLIESTRSHRNDWADGPGHGAETEPPAGENPAPQDSPDLRTLARIMDHTMLRPQATCEKN